MKDKIFEVAKNHTENKETAMQLTNELCVLLGVSDTLVCECPPSEADFTFDGLPCGWCTNCGRKNK